MLLESSVLVPSAVDLSGVEELSLGLKAGTLFAKVLSPLLLNLDFGLIMKSLVPARVLRFS